MISAAAAAAMKPHDTDDLCRRADENFVAFFRSLAENAPDGATVARPDGVRFVTTGVPVALFNPALLTGDEEFAEAVGAARAFYRARRVPWALVLPEHAAFPPPARLRDAGLFELLRMPVYAHDVQAGERWPAANPALTVRAADDDAAVADHRRMLDRAFRIPESMSAVVLPGVPPPGQRLRLYVAYEENGGPVGSAALCVAGGVAGVYNVGTDPARRREGVAATLMRRVVEDARDAGVGVCVLQSSEQGVPLYRQLGFTRLSTYAIYEDGEVVVA